MPGHGLPIWVGPGRALLSPPVSSRNVSVNRKVSRPGSDVLEWAAFTPAGSIAAQMPLNRQCLGAEFVFPPWAVEHREPTANREN